MNGAIKLDRANIEDIAALTPAQEGLLYHYRSGKDAGRYCQQLSLRLAGEPSMDALRFAWRRVARANEMLRTVFRWEKLEHPVQITLREHEIPIAERDYSAYPPAERERLLGEAREEERRAAPDIAAEPLRVLACRLDERSLEMIVTWHHILFDGWSNGILLREWLAAYDACVRGERDREPPAKPKPRFKEFVAWHQRADKEERRAYWTDYMADPGDRALLPFEAETDAAASGAGDGEPGYYSVSLAPGEVAALTAFARSRGATAAAVLYAVWALLLRGCSPGSRDVVFGTTVSGRTPELEGVEEMIGLFINTVPLRLSIEDGDSAESLVRRTAEALRKREPYESAPLTDIARWSGAESADDLFETLVVLDNYPLDEASLRSESLAVAGYRMKEATHYRLTLGIRTFGEWGLDFEYARDRFAEEDVARMAEYYRHLLRQVLGDPGRTVGSLELATDAEKERILNVFNRPLGERSALLVHRAFEEQVRRGPDRPAVVRAGAVCTYGELNARADRLARRLRRAGVARDRLVALLLDRDADLLAAMLAVLKAGGGYIPIDRSFAAARISYILEDSGADVLIVPEGEENGLPFGGTVVPFGGPNSEPDREAWPEEEDYDDEEEDEDGASRLAYVIYTSGSTGRPKGVLTEHRHLMAYVSAFRAEFRLGPDDVVLQQASCSFDHFVEEAYPALLSGGTVVVADREDVLDPDRLVRLIEANGVTIVTVQPLLLSELNKRGGVPGVRAYISGGDVFKYEHYSRLVRRASVYNSYGPTEATVCATYWRCGEEPLKNVPIGTPIAGYNVYILDAAGRLMPVGVPGEICISGRGVARGYLNREELTRDRFVPDPFRPGERMYRTGDLGVWRADGSVRFAGRVDEQVKIRGYRVDPREVELALLEHPAVAEAVVLAADDAGGAKALSAYLVTGEGTTARELREHLAGKVPYYMIPTSYYRIGAIPRTGNDKADKKALLRSPDRLPSGAEESGERSGTERAVAAVWREVLRLERVGAHDSFFDVGGNSLLLMQLQARLEREFAAGLSVTELFSLPTVRKQAEWIDRRRPSEGGADGAGLDANREGGDVAAAAYQPLPADYFGWGPEGESLLRSRLDPQLAAGLASVASEHGVERFDVLLAMWGYLFTEVTGLRTAVLHVAGRGGRTALPLRIELDRLGGFPDLFAAVRDRRSAEDAEGGYPLGTTGRFVPERGERETLPLAFREGEAVPDEGLVRRHGLLLGIEEAGPRDVGLSLWFDGSRLLREKMERLVRSYAHLLRQLSGTGVASS
ncbi:surfactin synthase subunit 3 [Cohnella xylanilytica]|uniref:non-ribosomal peptide synthetase n=1 Tax=Cohnella xylanilytica TaxID=557555 RepID=UPI001B16F5DE|nr:non-ribosomal peptide synthetase [Cohnella xylanilytica]GIO15046.1 surfactin synthase subunit 3 [Cohnella xylanilytica]